MNYIRRMQPLLGTFVEVGVAEGPAAGSSIDSAFAAVAEVHRLMSYQDPDSDLSRLNRGDGRPVPLRKLTVNVLRLARALMQASGGRFNCTVGGALERLGALPTPAAAARLDHGDADDIVIVDSCRVRLRRPVHITLDGIAKGFAVDRAVAALAARGANSGWVNAGGDLRVFGSVALPLSLREPGGFRTVGRLANRAAATSVTSGRPELGFPGRIVSTTGTGVSRGSWTVLARHAWRADALTKVAALLPDAQRAASIRRLGGTLLEAGSTAQ